MADWDDVQKALTEKGAWLMVSDDLSPKEEGKELTEEDTNALKRWLVLGAQEIDPAAKETLRNLPDDQRVLFVLRKAAERKQKEIDEHRQTVLEEAPSEPAREIKGEQDIAAAVHREKWAAKQYAERQSDGTRTKITAELMQLANLTQKIRRGYRRYR